MSELTDVHEDAPADESGPFDPETPVTDEPVEVPEAPVEGDEPVEPTEPESALPDESVGEPVEPVTEDKERTRAAPSDLQGDMKRVTDLFVTGNAEVLERLDGKPLTPSRVATEVAILRGTPDKVPSSGAVAAAFKRWAEYGFASFSEGPFAFADYTEAGREKGLKAILAERRAERQGTPADPDPEDATSTEG